MDIDPTIAALGLVTIGGLLAIYFGTVCWIRGD